MRNNGLVVAFVIGLALLASGSSSCAESLGKQLADYSRNDNTQGDKDCYNAVYNRLKHVFSKNNKTLPDIHGVANAKAHFKMLWVTNFDFLEWKDIDATYRACGPAGALVSRGFATLVNNNQIWEGKLEPGAIIQIWDVWETQDGMSVPSGKKVNGKAVFEAMHAGKDYANKLGHSFIFIAYKKNAAGKVTGMEIADQGTGWNPVSESKFGLWVGANLKE